jgi:hypothetical protein
MLAQYALVQLRQGISNFWRTKRHPCPFKTPACLSMTQVVPFCWSRDPLYNYGRIKASSLPLVRSNGSGRCQKNRRAFFPVPFFKPTDPQSEFSLGALLLEYKANNTFGIMLAKSCGSSVAAVTNSGETWLLLHSATGSAALFPFTYKSGILTDVNIRLHCLYQIFRSRRFRCRANHQCAALR